MFLVVDSILGKGEDAGSEKCSPDDIQSEQESPLLKLSHGTQLIRIE